VVAGRIRKAGDGGVDVSSIRVALAGLIGVALALVALTLGPSLAGADPTCYTGCATTVPAKVLATQTGQQPSVLASGATSSSALALTGSDIAGTVGIAVLALVGGGVLVSVSRRRRATS
jgi:hypothetical protein